MLERLQSASVPSLEEMQKRVCARFGSGFLGCGAGTLIALARDFDPEGVPLNGLRLEDAAQGSRWYVWSGETLETHDDHFLSLHARHLEELAPALLPFLGLELGWRFLIAPGHLDVWFDPGVLG